MPSCTRIQRSLEADQTDDENPCLNHGAERPLEARENPVPRGAASCWRHASPIFPRSAQHVTHQLREPVSGSASSSDFQSKIQLDTEWKPYLEFLHFRIQQLSLTTPETSQTIDKHVEISSSSKQRHIENPVVPRFGQNPNSICVPPMTSDDFRNHWNLRQGKTIRMMFPGKLCSQRSLPSPDSMAHHSILPQHRLGNASSCATKWLTLKTTTFNTSSQIAVSKKSANLTMCEWARLPKTATILVVVE